MSALMESIVPRWMRHYRRAWLPQDLIAGVVVTVMLMPQCMAYAVLAGMPPVTGIYASVLPAIVYALFGSSMTLAVGPAAITSLMTASLLAPLFPVGSSAYIGAAALLALLSGIVLTLLGLLRFGFIAQLLSRPVISGFTTGAGFLILVSQLGPLFGVRAQGGNAVQQLWALLNNIADSNPATALVGLGSVLLLVLCKRYGAIVLKRFGLPASVADIVARLSPIAVLLLAALLVTGLQLDSRHAVAVVGPIHAGLPPFHPELFYPDPVLWRTLLVPTLLLSLISYIASLSMAQSLATRRRERIDPNSEMRGIGVANIASALSMGFPVSGGLSRSVVSFAAGSRTPLSGIVAGVLMLAVLFGFATLFERLPLAVLAATIIVALGSLVDIGEVRRTWRYDRSDAAALVATALGVVLLDVETGLLIGIGLSLLMLLWRAGHPHIVELGRIPGTEHFRNVDRYQVERLAHVLVLRIDENLFFGNVRAFEQGVAQYLAAHDGIGDIVLAMSSVSHIDASAMESLRELNEELRCRDVRLHLAEVKGPVMDHLRLSPLPAELTGDIHLSLHSAFQALGGRPDWEI